MKECLKCKHCYEDDVPVCPIDGTALVVTITGPTTISGRYVLDSRLGQGGMGIVFRAKHLFLKSLHAVKIILPSLVKEDENLLVRFRQEAILAASINHPNVIRVTDFGVENDTMPFLVMEFINGIPLSDYLREGQPLGSEQAFGLFYPIAEGVAEAHSKGIVHRDLKPQNIMVQRDLPMHKAVKVLDFGLAKIKSTDSYPSLIQAKTMNIVGSPPYMSPEQWSGEGVDHRTDIYALAVVLYQMLVGHPPFQADSMPAMMYQHLTVPPPSAESFGVTLPPGVEEIIRKALEKEPENRYGSLDLMLSDLNATLGRPTTPAVAAAVTEVLSGRSSIDVAIPRPSTPGSGLSDSQKERFYSYFDSKQTVNPAVDPRLTRNFLDAQDRIEIAKTEAINADMLVQELAQAQKEAEQAQERALEAKRRIEADVRRQVEAEMQRLAAEERAKREAEAEALQREVDARRAAEERANYLAQAALDAQRLAERERAIREEEAQQLELHRGVREKAETEAKQLAAQVAEERRKYDEAQKEAAREAQNRAELEARQRKIESDLASLALNEAERRKQLESQAKKYIEEQAAHFEAEAQAAQKRLEEARELIDLEAQKREKAEAARIEAENEAARLSREILEVQRQMNEMRQHITYDSSSGPHTETGLDEDTGSGLTPITQLSGRSSADIPSSLLITSETPGRKPLVSLAAAGVVLLFLLAGIGIGFYFLALRAPDKTSSQEVARKSDGDQNTNSTSETDNFVLVEGGAFMMGRSDIGNPTDTVWGPQYPAHRVTVGTFYIAPTETTMAEYAECVKAARCAAPTDWRDNKPPEGKNIYPVVNVSFADAKAYAVWFSQREKKVCRLPEEKEWEYAARNGSSATNFPWGNEWRQSDAVLSGEAAPVGTSNDVTTTGIKDMLGNVSEWTSTSFYRYEGHPGGLGVDDKLLAVRGLNWATPANFLRTPTRLLTHRQFVDETEKTGFLGFRLVCEP
jgi:serine/threonine-protein kinase